jgi:rhamnosyltransferase
MQPEILISVVIPVKNGDHWLAETIPAILNQQVDGKIEIIAIDSGSTDKSLAILSSYSVTVIQINPNEFNHGLTRDFGAQRARGKFIAFTVQDAKPISSLWLQELLNGFIDETVAGVCGQQVVTHDVEKNPVEWYRPISKPELRKYQFSRKEDFANLAPHEQLAVCRWDDVNAMYRSEILKQLPFQKTDFAEDVMWAKDALLAGHSIVYNPKAQVAHYHYEDYDYAFKRNFIVQYHFYKYFGVLPINRRSEIIQILKNIKLLASEQGISLKKKWKWLLYNYRNQKAVYESNKLLLETVKEHESVDSVYQQVCKSVPQAIKATYAVEP